MPCSCCSVNTLPRTGALVSVKVIAVVWCAQGKSRGIAVPVSLSGGAEDAALGLVPVQPSVYLSADDMDALSAQAAATVAQDRFVPAVVSMRVVETHVPSLTRLCCHEWVVWSLSSAARSRQTDRYTTRSQPH